MVSYFRFIGLFLLLVYELPAQNIKLRNYTVNDGLPSSEIYSVLQDTKGYMWFCSDVGVCRYDGYAFKIFTSKDGLADNTIFKMYEDAKGRVWFSGMSNKLSYYDPTIDSIISIAGNQELNRLAVGGYISSLHIGEKDTLYIGMSYGKSFYKIPPTNNYKKVTPVYFDTDGWQFWFFDQIHFIWGVTYLKNENKGITISRYNKLKKKIISNNYPNSIITLHEQSRSAVLFKNDILLSEILHLNYQKKDQLIHTSLKSITNKLYVDKQGYIWCCAASGGVYKYKDGDFSTPIAHYLNNLSVTDIIEDNEGGYWISTLEHGVYYTPSLAFQYYDKSSGLSGNKVYSVTAYRDSIICFTENKTMDIIGKHIISVYPDIRGINAYEVDPKSNVLFVSHDSSYFYDLKTKKKVLVINYYDGTHQLFTRKAQVVSPEKIYVLTPLGICLINKSSNQPIISISGKKNVSAPIISLNNSIRTTSLYVSADTIWFGTPNNFYKYIKGKIDTLGNHFPLLKNRVDDIVEDSKHWLWLATKGEGILIKKGNDIKQLTIKDGLVSNICRTLLVDSNGVIWVGSNKGISRVEFTNNYTFKIENYSVVDGLVSDEIYKICRIRNNIYAATSMGVIKFNRNQIQTNKVAPKIYITKLIINDKEVSLKPEYTLEHDENFIRLSMLGISYKTPGIINYKYKLTGLDTNWYYTNNTTVQYTTLPPGHYTFVVYAINHNNISSDKPYAISFFIKKPYWYTWWFITLMVSLFFLGVYIVFLIRVRYIRRTEREKTLLNKKISEVELVAIRAQMSPHFIFNSINSIQHYILTNDSDTAYRYLSKFSKLIRNVLENSKHELITIQKEIETVELYIELEKLRFETKFNHQIIIDTSIDILIYGISPLLIQPYVENAIWHGLMHRPTAGLLYIQFINEDQVIRCIIEDDGIGRARSEELKKQRNSHHQSLALSLNKERLDIIGHLMHHKLQVLIIDKVNENNIPCGTRVEVEIPKINLNNYDKSHYSR